MVSFLGSLPVAMNKDVYFISSLLLSLTTFWSVSKPEGINTVLIYSKFMWRKLLTSALHAQFRFDIVLVVEHLWAEQESLNVDVHGFGDFHSIVRKCGFLADHDNATCETFLTQSFCTSCSSWPTSDDDDGVGVFGFVRAYVFHSAIDFQIFALCSYIDLAAFRYAYLEKKRKVVNSLVLIWGIFCSLISGYISEVFLRYTKNVENILNGIVIMFLENSFIIKKNCYLLSGSTMGKRKF